MANRTGAQEPRHAFEDHTGEVRLRVQAPTLPSLFEEAGRALAELMLERAADGPLGPFETVELESPDRAALLADWLNELVFLSETRQRVYTELHVESISDTHLRARVRGRVPEALRTAVKAATWHELRVDPEPDGYGASVVLDV